jgi:hypothetical protein
MCAVPRVLDRIFSGKLPKSYGSFWWMRYLIVLSDTAVFIHNIILIRFFSLDCCKMSNILMCIDKQVRSICFTTTLIFL